MKLRHDRRCSTITILCAALTFGGCNKKDDDSSDSSSEETDGEGTADDDARTKTKQPHASGGPTGGNAVVNDDEDYGTDGGEPEIELPLGAVATFEAVGPSTPHNGTCFPVKLRAKDEQGERIRADADVSFNASVTSGVTASLSPDSDCNGNLWSGTFPSGQSEMTIYFVSTLPEAVGFEINGMDITTTTWNAKLTPPVPAGMDFADYSATQGYAYGQFLAGQCAGPFYFNIHNPGNWGSYVIMTTSLIKNDIAYSGGDVKAYPTSACNGGDELTQWTLPANTVSTQQFWVKGTTSTTLEFKWQTPVTYSATLQVNYY